MGWSRSGSGLYVPSQGSDETAVRRMLKEYDPDLRLVPRGQHYSVYRYAGSERPAELVCTWADDQGRGLPLSSGVLEKVKMLDRNTRFKAPDADEQNAALKASKAKQQEDETQALVDDWMTRERRTALLPRSQSLRQARSKTGYHDSSS